MRAQREDIFAGILRELGMPSSASPSRSIVGADDASLADAAVKAASTATPDYLSHLVGAHAMQLSDERARREAAEREAQRTKTLVGWSVAGVLGAIVLFLIARRK